MSAATPFVSEVHGLPFAFARRWFAVFRRMVWKEFRVVAPFLLVVAATMAGLAALVAWAMRDQMHEVWGAMYAIVFLFPLLFALGCGGMSYAGEREDGTWDWLRRIAAPPSAVCAAKIFVGLSCSLGLVVAAWWALAWYAWQPQLYRFAADVGPHRGTLLLIGVSVTLLVSQNVSSLIKNVFVALIVSGIVLAPVLAVGLALGTDHNGTLFGLHGGINMQEIAFVGAGWIMAMLVLILCEFSLADCWLKDVPPWRGGLIGLVVNPRDRQQLVWSALNSAPPPLAHLISREWSLAKPWLWAFALTLVVPILTLMVPGWLGVRRAHYWQEAVLNQWLLSVYESPLLMLGCLMVAVVPALFGVWAYHPDQCELRFRFLADRGISPTQIWLSKHLVRLPMLLVLVLAVGCLAFVAFWMINQYLTISFSVFVAYLPFTLMCYAVGQLIGQLIRSPITSSFLAAVFALLLAVWVTCLRLLGVSVAFDLIPIAILFGASWLRMSDWLLERTSWRARLQLAGSLIIPFSLLYGVVGWSRTAGLPRVVRQPLAAPEARELASQWEQAESNGNEAYHPLDQSYRRGLSSFEQQLNSIFQTPCTLAVVCEAAQATTKPLDEERLQTLRMQVDNVTNDRTSTMGHEFTLGRLLESDEKFLEARIIVRHLHEGAYRETHDRLIPLTERDDVIWPFGMTQRIGILYQRYLPPLMGCTLLIAADARADRQEWDAAFTHSLAALRLAGQLSRSNQTHSPNYPAWTLRDPAWKQLLALAVRCRSADAVKNAIRQLADKKYQWPSRTEALAKSWSVLQQTNSRSVTAAMSSTGGVDVTVGDKSNLSAVLYKLFPYERERERRVVDLYVARDLALCAAADRVLKGETDVIRFIPFPANLPVEPTGIRWYTNDRLFDATLPITQHVDFNQMAQWLVIDQRLRFQPLQYELDRRILLLELALAAWHHERGAFPGQLSDLIGPILDQMPLDPLTGRPFDLITTDAEFIRRFPHSLKPVRPLPLVLPAWAPSRCQLRVDSPDGRGDVWIEMAPQYFGNTAAQEFAETKPGRSEN